MKPPLLMVGWDGADKHEIDALLAAGRLPNLARLRANGVAGTLSSPAPMYAGGVWPTFFTGQPVAAHGLYHNKQWRSSRMRVEVPQASWFEPEPFWTTLDRAGIASCIVDVPMLIALAPLSHGVQLEGWATHDLVESGATPASLWRSTIRRFGRPQMPKEIVGPQSNADLLRLEQALGKATKQLTDVAGQLLQTTPWQFGCVVFSALHRGGHYLPSESMTELYQQTDQALGELLARLPDNTATVVFSVHGMAANPGWSDLLANLLSALDEAETGEAPTRGLLFRLKQHAPGWAGRFVSRWLPFAWQAQLVQIWSKHMQDWTQTRWFPLPMDHSGYLRINLAGRESAGIVQPGTEYNSELQALIERVDSLVDGEGNPLVAGVSTPWRDNPDSPARDRLPDLVVEWTDVHAVPGQVVKSRQVPSFCYRVPPNLPSGRTGNHTGNAWYVASGSGIVKAPGTAGGAVADLAHNVLNYFELEGTEADFHAWVRLF